MNKIAKVVMFAGDSPETRRMTLNTTVLVSVDDSFTGTENESAHLQAQTIRKLKPFTPGLSDDFTMLYVNGLTCSRRQLGQRLYVVVKDDLILNPLKSE